ARIAVGVEGERSSPGSIPTLSKGPQMAVRSQVSRPFRDAQPLHLRHQLGFFFGHAGNPHERFRQLFRVALRGPRAFLWLVLLASHVANARARTLLYAMFQRGMTNLACDHDFSVTFGICFAHSAAKSIGLQTVECTLELRL